MSSKMWKWFRSKFVGIENTKAFSICYLVSFELFSKFSYGYATEAQE